MKYAGHATALTRDNLYDLPLRTFILNGRYEQRIGDDSYIIDEEPSVEACGGDYNRRRQEKLKWCL